jgi:hypothetical protein
MDRTAPDRMARLPLRAELYLIAHDDDSGEAYLNEQTLSVGLAGAILLELWLADRIAIGWTFDGLYQQWRQAPGAITITNERPLGDPLSDAALAAIDHTRFASGGHLRGWMRTFASVDLYHRVQANMVAVGVLRRVSRRRYGIVRSDSYVAVHDAWAIRVRAHLRSVLTGYENAAHPGREYPDGQCIALCGLADILELAPFLHHLSLTDSRVRQLMRHIVRQHRAEQRDGTIAEVVAAVDAGRGDLAVAAMA